MIHRTQAISRTMTLAVAAALTSTVIAATPARALDDGDQSFLDTVKGIAGSAIGFGFGTSDEEEKPRIQYRARAPLVLPPKSTLPPPGAGAGERNANWPKDYDEDRRQRANASRGRTQSTDTMGTNRMSNEELARGRAAPVARDVRDEQCGVGGTNAYGEICDTDRYWRVAKATRSQDTSTRDLAAGVEPPRKALTEPPNGYRRATAAVRYTQEAPREDVDITDPRAQQREDERRRRARDQ